MVCYTTCGVAGVFLFSMVYMTFAVDKNYVKDDLMKMLTPELQEKYRHILKERRDIYLTGFVGGLIISLGTWMYLKNNYKMEGFHSACYLIAMTYIFCYIYYTMTPKSDLLVVYLDDPAAREKWVEVYKYMQYNYHMSMLLGIVFVGLLGYGMC